MKLKYNILILILILILIFSISINVNATVVSYGYVDCDYDCSILGTIKYPNGKTSYGQNICHDRWKPENNSCKGGTRHDNNGTLIIDYNGSSVNMASTTDLFGIGSSLYEEGKKIKHFGIEDGEKNVFMTKTGKVTKIYYVHDFRPLIEYYELTGKYPTYVVADYTGVDHSGTVISTSYLRYTYYPSDFQTTEQDFELEMPTKVVSYEDVDLIVGDAKKWCRNVDYFKDHPDNGSYQQVVNTCWIGSQGTIHTIHYFFSTDLSENADLNSCDDLSAMVNKAKEAYKEGGHDSEEYISAYKWILAKCGLNGDGYIDKRYFSTESECYNICISFSDDFAEMDPEFMKYTNHCGFGEEMIAWIMRILKILRYIVPIIVIVTSTIEYISAIGAADDDAMKKTGNRFSKRLLIMIVFFILPSILQFLFNIFNVPGLDSSDPYCMKF